MPWNILAAVTLATAGLLVLGVLGLRAWAEAQRLSRTLDACARRLAGSGRDVERSAEQLARQAAFTGAQVRRP
ncbi:hypothetical protein [Streptacidiphilus monticola]|jgi:hypothetical protein|uniref:Uncharacterized protein n=1 Tax=Streptacidiphilus monticola TaxID=2161674 RepID=A0ABW1G548_9ACTN